MPKLTIFITCIFLGMATHPSFAETFTPLPSVCEASQFQFVGMTPDNEILVASSSHEVVLINVESGETLFHSQYRGNIFEPHGVSSDGKLLIGGGYGVPQATGAQVDDLSVYYCPSRAT